MARQLVRLLIDPNDDAFRAATAGGTFHGGHVDGLTGGAGLAVNADRTGLAEDFLISTAGGPNAGGFVNSPAFSPAEAALVKDLGVPLFFDVNSLGYLDGDGTTQHHSFSHSFGGFDGKAIWTLNGGNRVLSIRGGTSGSGNGSAHIRVQGAADQTVGSTRRFEGGSRAKVSGPASVALLFASGANHALVNRGTIIAEGAEAVGADAIAVDTGDAAPVFNGATYDLVTFGSKQTGRYLVDRMDLGGTVSSHLGDAVRIGNGGPVREINLLGGLSLVGALTSDGFAGATDGGAGLGAIAAPRLTFGRKTGADGRATDLSENYRDNFDGTFALDYAGDIGGATGFDAEVYGGSTHLRGDVAFNSILMEAGSLQTHGVLTVAPRQQSIDSAPADLVATRVKRGALAVSGTADLGGVELGSGDGWAGKLTILGDTKTGALDQFGGSILADVDIVDKLGVLRVMDGGSLTTKDVRNKGSFIVEKGGSLVADSLELIGPDAKFDLAGSVSLGGFAEHKIGGALNLDGKFNAHILTLLNTAKVTGSGTIDTSLFVASGTLAPGNSPGTLTVSGDFRSTPTAVYEIEVVPTADPVAGTDNDLIAVDGDAEVDGGTLRVLRWGAGDYLGGTEYTFLTADSLTVTDPLAVFSGVTGVAFSTRFDGTSYRIVVVDDAATLADRGRTFNQFAVGSFLDAAGDGAADLRAALDSAPTDSALRDGLEDLSGEVYGTFLTAANRSSLEFFDLLAARTGSPLLCPDCGTESSIGAGGLSGWLSGYGAGGRVNGDGNARRAEPGTAGTAVGLSACLTDALRVGTFYGFESITARAGNGSVTSDIHRVGGWATAAAGPAYARLAGQAGFSESESRRSFAPAGVLPLSGGVNGEFDGVLSGGDAEAGWVFGDAAGYLAPLAGLRYVHADQDGFTETGGAAALRVSDFAESELRARLGVRAGRALPGVAGVPVAGTLNAFYSRDVKAGTTGDVDAVFASAADGKPAFRSRGTDFRPDRVVVGPGLVIGGGAVRFSVDYRADLSDSAVLHAGGARIDVCF